MPSEDPPRIIVIGRHSMIGRVLQHDAGQDWHFLSHREALEQPQALRTASCVLNLAYDPRLRSAAYDPAHDIDLAFAARLAGTSTRYVMLSSRTVYGINRCRHPLVESQAPQPNSLYGMAKAETERRLATLLAGRLTILRLSNIFDGSEAEGERSSFFGLALRGLARQGRIRFDMSPFMRRDFLPAGILSARLRRIIAEPRAGIFNIGAGFSVRAGYIAQWLIEGFGGGELLVTDFRAHDEFALDIARAEAAWQFPRLTMAELRASCTAIGRRIKAGEMHHVG